MFILCPIGAILAVAMATIARKAERSESSHPPRLRNAFSACVLISVRDAVHPQTESW